MPEIIRKRVDVPQAIGTKQRVKDPALRREEKRIIDIP